MTGSGSDRSATLTTTLPAPAVTAPLARGSSLGRYLVLEPLGSGAAGIVYTAYDPQLDRRIALKLLREPAPRARDRFLREMRAVARLQHPHVVTLYDASEIDGRPFLAMELCTGGTLRDWCRAAPRTPDAVLSVFLEAGDGLAAAHAAGFVHRDFKPSNVLMTGDGRPRVSDFGLVRAAHGEPAAADAAGPAERDPQTMTGSGAIVGTLAYMASEQLSGGLATAASDQFSYCASLYEVLFGQPGFAGHTADELARAIARGPQVPEIRSSLERRIWRVLRRGLAAAPQDRFGSMTELLGSLRRVRRGRTWLAVAGAGVLVVLAASALIWHGRPPSACEDARSRLAGVWDPERRTRIAGAFHAAGRAHGDASLALVDRALDDYAAAWATMRDDACRATRERHEQSPQLLDLRIACLDQRREELRAVTEALGHADGALVDSAATSVRTLSNLARCSDAAALLSVIPPPDDARLRERIERVRAGLARVHGLQIASQLAEAHREAATLLTEAQAIGYPPLQAEALYRDEQIDLRPSDLGHAAAELRDAIVLAETGHDQEMQLLGWAALPFVQAIAGERDAVRESLRHGAALLDGLGSPSRLEAPVMTALGSAASFIEQLDDAERWELRALRAGEQLYPPGDVALGGPHASLGNIYMKLGRIDDSLRHQRAALEIYERAFGDAHPRVCVTRLNLAGELEQADRLEEAQTTAHRAVGECERASGPRSAQLVVALLNESNALQRLGRLDEALPVLLRAREMSDAVNGPEGPETNALMANLAELRAHRGEIDAALGLIDQALAIATRRFGPDSPTVRRELETQTEILRLAGRAQDAIAPAERYRELAAHVPGGDVRGRVVLARVLVAAHRPGEARTLLAPVLDSAHPLEGKPIDVAAARWVLGWALRDADPGRGRALEQAGRAALTELGPAGREVIRDLERQVPETRPPAR